MSYTSLLSLSASKLGAKALLKCLQFLLRTDQYNQSSFYYLIALGKFIKIHLLFQFVLSIREEYSFFIHANVKKFWFIIHESLALIMRCP